MSARGRDYKGGPPPLWTTWWYYLPYKERKKPYFCLWIKLTEVFDVPWVWQRNALLRGKTDATGATYFRHFVGPLPARGEFVEPFSV